MFVSRSYSFAPLLVRRTGEPSGACKVRIAERLSLDRTARWPFCAHAYFFVGRTSFPLSLAPYTLAA